MLNFEEEMKQVQAGYVVMSLEEYNKLRDKIAEARTEAELARAEVHSTVLKYSHAMEEFKHNLLSVRKKPYGDNAIEVCFNDRAVHQLAVEMLHDTFSAEELADYEVRSIDDLLLCDEAIARLRDPEAE